VLRQPVHGARRATAVTGAWQTVSMSNPPPTDRSDAVNAAPGDLSAIADRLSSLADTAELMEDGGTAARFRDAAAVMRLQAMGLLDE
jgi:hypothetical protein